MVATSKAQRSQSGAAKGLDPAAGNVQLSGAPTPRGSPRASVFAEGSLLRESTWGTAPGQLGRLLAHESNPEDPMSLAMGPLGEVCVLDQVNDRMQCFAKDGSLAKIFPLGRTTAQDLQLDGKGGFAVLDRLGASSLLFYNQSGKLTSEIPLLGGLVREGGGVTALLRNAHGDFLVEIEHRAVVRIAFSSGDPDGQREVFPGRPTRDGRFFVAAQLKSAADGVVSLAVFNADKSPAWQQDIRLESPISHLVLLDSDRAGNIFLGAQVGKRGDENSATLVMRITGTKGAGGRDTLVLPAKREAPEKFRDMIVTDEGALVHLQSGARGVQIKKYEF